MALFWISPKCKLSYNSELARSLGRAQHEYKKAKQAIEKEAENFKEAVEKVGEAEANAVAGKTAESKDA